MEIKKIKIKDLNIAEYNPRENLLPGDERYEAIKKSLDVYGLVEPIVVNARNNVVVSGHQRLKILKERGETEVEASFVDLDEDAEKGLSLALNKIEGSWDREKLWELHSELGEDHFTGFDADEIEAMRQELDEEKENMEQAAGVIEARNYYTVSISFDNDEIGPVQDYIAEHGKEPLSELIIEVAKEERGKEWE